MTTSKPHPPRTPVHPVLGDGTRRYQPLDYRPLVNGRQPDGPDPNPYIGRRAYHAFQGKKIRIPIITEFVVGNIGLLVSGLLVPFGTAPGHVISAIGFVGAVIILNAACCSVYAYKWKTRKTIIVAIAVTFLATVVSIALIIGPVISLLRDRYIWGLVLQVILVAVGVIELGLSAFIAKTSLCILLEGDKQHKGRIRTISCDRDDAPMV